jgi:heat-inducible transcriptional repressor
LPTNFESLLQKAAKVLARLSGYIILITPPQNSANILKHLQLVPVSAKQAILIVVTECFQTQSIVIDAPEFTNKNGIYEKDLVEEELQILSNFLNSKLKGKTCAELVTLDWSELDRKFAKSADFLRKLLTVLSRLHTSVNHTPILMTGISEALRQPEFSQMQQVQMLLHLLEEQPEQLLPLILEVPEFERTSPKVTVRIGAENPLEPMRICSLIAANYYRDRVPVGSVSAIGPTRMLYENTILMVEATADYLSEILS